MTVKQQFMDDYALKHKARYMVQDALRAGKLTKANVCSICAQGGRLDGHHEDYNKPLSVIWCCRSCHAKIHKSKGGRMNEEKETSLWEELVKFTGSEEKALKLSKILDRRKNTGLTDTQRIVWDYIRSGKPLGSLRQLALACGIQHPQTMVAVLSALVMKGYLVPNKDME